MKQRCEKCGKDVKSDTVCGCGGDPWNLVPTLEKDILGIKHALKTYFMSDDKRERLRQTLTEKRRKLSQLMFKRDRRLN